MFANLLPGLRELRAPLVAGYLWLATAWFLFGDRFAADSSQTTPQLRQVYRLFEFLGRPATLAALTVVAYLIGLVSLSMTEGLRRGARWIASYGSLFGRWRRRGSNRRVGELLRDTTVLQPAQRVVLARLDRRLLKDAAFRDELRARVDQAIVPAQRELWVQLQTLHRALTDDERSTFSVNACRSPFPLPFVLDAEVNSELQRSYSLRQELLLRFVDLELYVQGAVREVEELPARLLKGAPEVFAAYDRLRAEAEFRNAVALPLTALLVTFTATWSTWWIFGLLLPAALLLLAHQSSIRAGKQLAEAFAVTDEAAALAVLDTDDIGLREQVAVELPREAAVRLRDHGIRPGMAPHSRVGVTIRLGLGPSGSVTDMDGNTMPLDVRGTSPSNAPANGSYNTRTLLFGDEGLRLPTWLYDHLTFPGMTPSVLNKAVFEAVNPLLDVDLGQLVLSGLRRQTALVSAALRTQSSSQSQEVVDLGTFQVSFRQQPSIDIGLDGTPVARMNVELSCTVEVSQLIATVTDGKLTATDDGRAAATLRLTVDGAPIAVRNLDLDISRLVVPGEGTPLLDETS